MRGYWMTRCRTSKDTFPTRSKVVRRPRLLLLGHHALSLLVVQPDNRQKLVVTANMTGSGRRAK